MIGCYIVILIKYAEIKESPSAKMLIHQWREISVDDHSDDHSIEKRKCPLDWPKVRVMNVVSMLPWEEQVMRYLDRSENHVLYRVTPYFKGKELLVRGVEMGAYSVEGEGKGICFHVFVYNVQPGIMLDYATGESWVE